MLQLYHCPLVVKTWNEIICLSCASNEQSNKWSAQASHCSLITHHQCLALLAGTSATEPKKAQKIQRRPLSSASFGQKIKKLSSPQKRSFLWTKYLSSTSLSYLDDQIIIRGTWYHYNKSAAPTIKMVNGKDGLQDWLKFFNWQVTVLLGMKWRLWPLLSISKISGIQAAYSEWFLDFTHPLSTSLKIRTKMCYRKDSVNVWDI